MIARTLFLRLADPGASLISKPAFMKWWSARNLASMPGIKRVFEALRKENQEVRAFHFKRQALVTDVIEQLVHSIDPLPLRFPSVSLPCLCVLTCVSVSIFFFLHTPALTLCVSLCPSFLSHST